MEYLEIDFVSHDFIPSIQNSARFTILIMLGNSKQFGKRLKTMSALEPTTQIFVKNRFSSNFWQNTSNICCDEKWSLFGQIQFYKIFSNFLDSHPKITQNQQFQQQI